jgi:pyridoxamine 5'-phosphate oxidase
MTTVDNQAPFAKIHDWIEKEKALGSPSPDRVVLATTTPQGVPHSRLVAVRELTAEGVLFFTQQGTRKTLELGENPDASMTLWLALQQRQVILDGIIHPLSQQENESYWKTMPLDRQLRFSAYAPTSGQPISSLEVLESTLAELIKKFGNAEIPMSEYYCGFRLIPAFIYFYTLGTQTFSEVMRYERTPRGWEEQLLSP